MKYFNAFPAFSSHKNIIRCIARQHFCDAVYMYCRMSSYNCVWDETDSNERAFRTWWNFTSSNFKLNSLGICELHHDGWSLNATWFANIMMACALSLWKLVQEKLSQNLFQFFLFWGNIFKGILCCVDVPVLLDMHKIEILANQSIWAGNSCHSIFII